MKENVGEKRAFCRNFIIVAKAERKTEHKCKDMFTLWNYRTVVENFIVNLWLFEMLPKVYNFTNTKNEWVEEW